MKILHVLAVALGIVVSALTVHAADAVSPRALVHERPSAQHIDFVWLLGGDANHNATAELEQRKAGDVEWSPCHAKVRRGEDDWLGVHTLQIVVSNLAPATDYDFRLRISDPDGVEGDAERTVPVKTAKLHVFEPQWGNHVTDFAVREPVLRIGDGDTVQTKSWMWNFLNGPFYIEGAEPGDTLAVRLELVESEGRGESGGVLVRWAVDPQTAGELPESHGSSKWTVDREAGTATVTEVTVPSRVGSESKPTKVDTRASARRGSPDPATTDDRRSPQGVGDLRSGPWLGQRPATARVGSESKPTKVDTRAVGLRVPLEPMIGDMGVAVDAPPGKAPHMVDCGRHGGNLDWKGVKAGTTMYYWARNETRCSVTAMCAASSPTSRRRNTRRTSPIT